MEQHPETPPLVPSAEARVLAATLAEVSEQLDALDMRAPEAMSAVRAQARRLAQSLRERGWADLFLGVDGFHNDEGDELDLDEDEQDDDPLPEGPRLSHQARIDFVVTAPDLLIAAAKQSATAQGIDVSGDFEDEISYLTGALGYLEQEEGIAPRDYEEWGLRLGGAQSSQTIVPACLWEMSPEAGDDAFPFP